jgi:hypothetical protein
VLVDRVPPPSDTGSEPVVVLFPPPARVFPRVVGPGRREREYIEKLAERQRVLDAAALVERGSARRLDRMERKLEAVREAALAAGQRENRLILALGALQRENEMLREKLALRAGERRRLALPAKRSFLARLFERAT